MRKLLFCCLVLVLIVSAGCEKKVGIPSYINLLNPVVLYKGDTLRQAMTDVWCFQYPNQLATIEFKRTQTGTLAALLPILNQERTRYFFRGGVYVNGNPTQRRDYPFWEFDSLDVRLTPEQIYAHQPRFRYRNTDSIIQVAFEENFDGTQLNLTTYNNDPDQALLVINQSAGYLGQRCGVALPPGNYFNKRCGEINFDSTHKQFSYTNISFLDLPVLNTEVWAEVVYKGSISLGLGIIREYNGQTLVYSPAAPVIPPSSDCWQTLYYNLTNNIRGAPLGTRFKLFLNSASDGSSRNLLIDNIRILHFR